MNCLVVGGAGYIGSHMVKYLISNGYKVTVFDNLSTGFSDSIIEGHFVRGDLAVLAEIEAVLRDKRIDAVFHFASSIQVGESIKSPAKYYRNNFCNTLNLLDAMLLVGVKRLVFSSTAAVYGEPDQVPIHESQPRAPINPYGRTKSMVEDVLQDYHFAYGFQAFSLRYFNAAGADPAGIIGERHDPETHLIPLVLQVASGRRDSVTVFGNNYDTPDGTCIRDYIHVCDLARAHELALNKLMSSEGSYVCNLGTGRGYSVTEVIKTVERVTGRKVQIDERPRRYGDPACLVADPSMAAELLGWRPIMSDLDTIVAHAWKWEQTLLKSIS